MLESQANRCFVCGPGNSQGLHVEFHLEEDVCRAAFTPGLTHVGYDKVTHGGILFSLLDDVMANWLWLQGEQCFTAKAEVRYRAQLPVGKRVLLEGRLQKRKGRLAILEGLAIREDSGDVVAQAVGSFMTVPPEA